MNLPNQTLIRKAYAAAYAGFRTAQAVNNAGLREAIEKYSLALLLGALEPSSDGIVRQTSNLEYVIGFGRDVGDIHPQTAELMLAELSKLPKDSAITESGNPPALTREDLFPVAAWDVSETKKAPEKKQETSIPSTIPLTAKAPSRNLDMEESGVRKEKIVARIRQSGNCRMKDIQEVMPTISERTLRYDLQRLVQDNIIERVGQSGPSTYYRIK